jgi:hypothetical protein
MFTALKNWLFGKSTTEEERRSGAPVADTARTATIGDESTQCTHPPELLSDWPVLVADAMVAVINLVCKVRLVSVARSLKTANLGDPPNCTPRAFMRCGLDFVDVVRSERHFAILVHADLKHADCNGSKIRASQSLDVTNRPAFAPIKQVRTRSSRKNHQEIK